MRDDPKLTHGATSDQSPASAQPTSAPQDTNTTARGVALIGADLNLVAVDAVVGIWINRAVPSPAVGAATLDGLLAAANLPENVRRTLDGGEPVSFVARLRGANDANAHVQVSLRRLVGDGAALVLATIELAQAPGAMSIDALTQLPDRRELPRRIADWRRTSSDAPLRFAVLFLDLDDFKAVNDQFGHAVGDAVLRELAVRWLHCIREGDLVCRFGGDEFVLLIRNVAKPRDVAPVIARLRQATVAPVTVDGVAHAVHATIGSAVATVAGESLDDLIAAADRDMYAHKPRVLR
jgi:diguanylate cyclase (GGDEF)-like protein